MKFGVLWKVLLSTISSPYLQTPLFLTTYFEFWNESYPPLILHTTYIKQNRKMIQDGLKQLTLSDPRKVLLPN